MTIMKKTGIIGEYKQADGWHIAGTFDSPAAARAWREAVDEAEGHHHARRTRWVRKSSRAWEAALEAEICYAAAFGECR